MARRRPRKTCVECGEYSDDVTGIEVKSMCSNCSGTGEGMYDGNTCMVCHGSGESINVVDLCPDCEANLND